jgi:hypothetical protein
MIKQPLRPQQPLAEIEARRLSSSRRPAWLSDFSELQHSCDAGRLAQ